MQLWFCKVLFVYRPFLDAGRTRQKLHTLCPPCRLASPPQGYTRSKHNPTRPWTSRSGSQSDLFIHMMSEKTLLLFSKPSLKTYKVDLKKLVKVTKEIQQTS